MADSNRNPAADDRTMELADVLRDMLEAGELEVLAGGDEPVFYVPRQVDLRERS